jgi:hypothetical protein
VNVTVLVVAPKLVTLMFAAPGVAVAGMVNVAVIWVLLITVVLATVIDAPPVLIVAPVV